MTTSLHQPILEQSNANDAQSAAAVEVKLEDTRRRLLDLTRRNRLLNHRTTGRGTLRIIDELPTEVFRLLVAEEHTLQFLAREEAPKDAAALVEAEAAAAALAADHNADVSIDEQTVAAFSLAPIDSGTSTASRHSDKNLQTTLAGDPLQSRLLYLAREAVSAREEQGCNILYLTLGVVEWCESGRDGVSRAPLLFIPVDLQRRSVRTRHSLTRYEDDILINPCLVELCRRIFHFELPTVDIDESLDIDTYFASVSDALRALPGWRLVPEIHVGLFSFAKLLMYRDLDPANWPAKQRLAAHPLVRRLSGFAADIPGDNQPMLGPAMLDNTIKPADNYQVVDADSSQQVAIYAAKQGFSAVIEGPPGTGKSQTITNIIAECLAADKTVLFVAEKSAALSVVKRRLEAIGLGTFVLELHSNKTGKRIVLEELQRTLTAYEEPLAVGALDPAPLESARARLNSYAHDLHAPLGNLAISPYEAIARALAVRDAPEPECDISDPSAWTDAQLRDALELLDTCDRWRARVGDITQHPWRAIRLTALDTSTRQALQRAHRTLLDALHGLDMALQRLAADLQVATPETLVAGAVMLEHARCILALPDLASGVLADDRWESQAELITAWLAVGRERRERQAFWSEYATPEAEQIDWTPILQRRREHSESIAHTVLPGGVEDRVMRWFSAGWKADAATIEQYLKPAAVSAINLQLNVLESLIASDTLRVAALAGVNQHAELFRTHWQTINGDWDALQSIFQAAITTRQMIRSSHIGREAAQRFLERGERGVLAAHADELERAIARTEQAWQGWSAATGCELQVWLGGDMHALPLASLLRDHAQLVDAFEQLDDWIQYQRTRTACHNGALQSLMLWAEQPTHPYPLGQLANSFTRQFYQLWLDEALRQRPSLGSFRGDDHDALIKRFRTSDTAWIESNRRRVAERIRSRMPDLRHEAHRESKLGILKGEMRKKRRHMALRKLFALTGDVLQAIKPCFMMSPISIAQYLAPGTLAFDLVIFDEASQVEPADAYGAIARGRQVLLVGDEKQLPPTSFFTKIEVDETPAEDETLAASDLESVLSLGVVRLQHQCSLRWHYRSRHASLIDFSNHQFYDGKLHIFPGPYADTDEFGLAFHFVEGGVYMRGAGQHNPVEARAVAEAALRHALDRPHLTLGVGAFSGAQQRAIEDEIERIRRVSADPRVEAFFAAQSHEPFFVKNLETIQGDERDVILLSVGYGPDQNGKVAMNFGPLNRDGGWRRLNVLVTRARQRCVLFSSIHADQINLSATRARGVAALKAYLSLAEQSSNAGAIQTIDTQHASMGETLSQTLCAHGYEVHANVGTVGSFVNLAVVDPDRPGRYLLGVENDGAVYASAPTARDRDRLRQQVLEDLGWQIHRVWSLDWYQRPEMSIKRLLERLAVARGHQPHIPTIGATTKLDVGTVPDAPISVIAQKETQIIQRLDEGVAGNATLSSSIPAYRASTLRTTTSVLPLAQITIPTLARVIAKLVEDESPIHEEEVQRVMAAYYGTRASKNARQILDQAMHIAYSDQLVRRQGAFLWSLTMRVAPVRRHGDDCPVSKAELIAPEELQETVKAVVAREFGMKAEALIVSTSRALGYRRCGANLEAAIRQAVQQLLTQAVLASDSEGFLKVRS